MHRVHWRYAATVLFLVFLLAACGSANQSKVRSSISLVPSDTNPTVARTTSGTATSMPPPSPTARVATPAPGIPPHSLSSQEGQLQHMLFQQINQDRAAQGLSAYTLNSTMSSGARQHSITMSGSCGMQHQCPGEPSPCQRVSNEGISWTICGENIGYAGGYQTAWAGVAQIEQAMLNERPPNDGHRRNLLSTSFHRIGVGIYIDARGIVWVTEDFAN